MDDVKVDDIKDNDHFKEPKGIVISHKEDVDGIVSAVFSYYYLKTFIGLQASEIMVYLVNYNEVHQTLSKIIPAMDSKYLILTDIGLNPKIIQVFDAFPQISNQNRPRYYLDHHEIMIELMTLKTKFTTYINPEDRLNKKDPHYFIEGVPKTSACLCYDYFLVNPNWFNSKKKPFPIPAHFNQLQQYAFETDNESILKKPISARARQLKYYISFYQNDQSKLLGLIHNLLQPDSFHRFEDNLDQELRIIEKWIADQQDFIKKIKEKTAFQNYQLISAVANLRSGEITKFLQDTDPDCDFYIGLSIKEKYMNIRTKIPIAAEIAIVFEGGGHKDRAGFPIPLRYLPEILDKPNLTKIPKSFLDEIILNITQLSKKFRDSEEKY